MKKSDHRPKLSLVPTRPRRVVVSAPRSVEQQLREIDALELVIADLQRSIESRWKELDSVPGLRVVTRT